MRAVAVDASLWDEPVTGIGLYTRELVRALQARSLPVERWGARRTGEVPRGRASRTGWTLTTLPGLLATREPALYHALANFNLPLLRVEKVPFVLTVHDLVPLLLPDTVSAAFRWQFRAWLSRSLAVAARVICISETTRRSLHAHFDVDERRVSVVPQGLDHLDRVPAPDRTSVAWLDAQGLPERFVLYAGALDARKNVELVLRACERLFDRGRPTTLVLAGQRWFGARPIEREIQRVRERGVDVRALGYLADPVFTALMKRATVFAFPSRYEGFGLPPLEAMRLGVATVVSNAGSLPEVCGDGAWQVDVDDAEDLAHKLATLLDVPSERAALARQGQAKVRDFTWENTAKRTAAVYRSIADV